MTRTSQAFLLGFILALFLSLFIQPAEAQIAQVMYGTVGGVAVPVVVDASGNLHVVLQ